ncbi:MAG: GGDEF domain-containing protein, partial [Solirubrobacterales bacterium]|nr:GGDEF domain-containing protein [Solirubrobacterales bacterium]
MLPALHSAVVVCDLVTCALLLQQFLSRGTSRLLGLAATYLFCALAAAAQGLLASPADTPTWPWMAWQAGLPVGLALAMWGGPRATRRRLAAYDLRRGRAAALALGGVALLAAAGAAADGVLPAVGADGGPTTAAGALVLAIDLPALAFLLRRGRRDALERRLPAVAACASAGVALALAATGPETAAWYGALALALAASAVLLVALVTDVGRLYRTLEDAEHDALTGLATRASALAAAEDLHRRRGADEALAIAIVDLDGFARVGAAHGDLAGDAVLQTVAGHLRDALRDEDVVGRFEGDAFVAVLPGTAVDGATPALERVLGAIRDAAVGTWAHDLRVTASAGLAPVGGGERAVDVAVAAAEAAVARAKAAGGDRL